MKKINPAHLLFETHLKEARFPFGREFQFHQVRRWRFDYVLLNRYVAIEIEGGTWISGRHNTGAGMQGDCDKYNEAVKLGWKVIRFTTQDILSGKAIQFLKDWLL